MSRKIIDAHFHNSLWFYEGESFLDFQRRYREKCGITGLGVMCVPTTLGQSGVFCPAQNILAAISKLEDTSDCVYAHGGLFYPEVPIDPSRVSEYEFKKQAERLMEMGFDRDGGMFIIAGTGLNVRRGAYPPELADRAIALEERCAPPDRSAMIAAYLNRLEAHLDAVQSGYISGITKTYHELSCTLGQEVQVISPAETFTGTALEVDESGALLVRTAMGDLRRVLAGDVSVRGMMGYV